MRSTHDPTPPGLRTRSSKTSSSVDKISVPFQRVDRLFLRRLDEPPDGEDIQIASISGEVTVRGEGPYFDGPVAARVAIVDLDAESGTLRPGARFRHPKGTRKGTYEVDAAALEPVPAPADLEVDSYVQVSTFANVMLTLQFFERADMVGRRLRWAFASPQLLVVPRAGVMDNAFYERETGSLQFFSYPAADGELRPTALSPDIVRHETAHAILDGIAPDLYDAITPQSFAIHESIADLTAVCMSLLDENIVWSLVNISGGNLDVSSALARVAEEFGSDIPRTVHADYLRAAVNTRTLEAADHSVDEHGEPNSVDRIESHALSEVLTGALYNVFLKTSESLRRPHAEGWEDDIVSAAEDLERRLTSAATRLARLVFGALDHLPPGQICFADLARAIVAVDRLNNKSAPQSEWLADELVRRGVVTSPESITDVPYDFTAPELDGVDLDALVANDDAAKQFAEANRRLLNIPKRTRFEVLPRDVVTRKGAKHPKNAPTDIVFRVRWHKTEEHDFGPEFGHRWKVAMGTTMVIDKQRRRVKTLLSTDASEEQCADRHLLLQRWINEGIIVPKQSHSQPDALIATKLGNGQVVRGGARLLHLLDTSP